MTRNIAQGENSYIIFGTRLEGEIEGDNNDSNELYSANIHAYLYSA